MKGLKRIRAKGIVGGVVAGIAAALGWDPWILRIITSILLVTFGTPVALVYFILWLFLPDEGFMGDPEDAIRFNVREISAFLRDLLYLRNRLSVDSRFLIFAVGSLLLLIVFFKIWAGRPLSFAESFLWFAVLLIVILRKISA